MIYNLHMTRITLHISYSNKLQNKANFQAALFKSQKEVTQCLTICTLITQNMLCVIL